MAGWYFVIVSDVDLYELSIFPFSFSGNFCSHCLEMQCHWDLTKQLRNSIDFCDVSMVAINNPTLIKKSRGVLH